MGGPMAQAMAPGSYFSRRAARRISRHRRWPKPIPRSNAFFLSSPTERLVSFDILATGVRAFEWSLSSFRSAFVHSRRLPVFLTALAFFKSIAPIDKGRLLARFHGAASYEQETAMIDVTTVPAWAALCGSRRTWRAYKQTGQGGIQFVWARCELGFSDQSYKPRTAPVLAQMTRA